jgi:hypothetical protein
VKGPGRVKRRRDESGVTVVEFVVLTPILFLLMFGSVQIGLALFARHVAVSAAQEGARVAREDADNPNVNWQVTAPAAADNWATSLLHGLISGAPNAVPQGPPKPQGENPEVGVSVNFSIVTIMPGWDISVNATSIGPVECFYDPLGNCVAD